MRYQVSGEGKLRELRVEKEVGKKFLARTLFTSFSLSVYSVCSVVDSVLLWFWLFE
jgi:hypothetical protein